MIPDEILLWSAYCRNFARLLSHESSMINPPLGTDRELFRSSLDDLMTQYQQADKEAAANFVALVSPMLFRYFCHHTGHPDDASDLLQEAWLHIHKSRNTFRSGDSVLPWLFGIARHVQVDGFRRKQRIRANEKAMDLVPEASAFGEFIKAQAPGFEELIHPLPHNQREVVTMLKVTGMSLEEIAMVTGCSVGAVKQRAHRAYETLRKLLAAAHPTSGMS